MKKIDFALFFMALALWGLGVFMGAGAQRMLLRPEPRLPVPHVLVSQVNALEPRIQHALQLEAYWQGQMDATRREQAAQARAIELYFDSN